MATPVEIPFQQLLDALLDTETPFHPRFLYRLSDLSEADLASLEKVWLNVPAWRRKALMEDVEELGERDTLLSFETLAKFASHDQDAEVRLPAVRALWEYDDRELISLFLNFLEKDRDPKVRGAAAFGLGRFVFDGELENIPAARLHEIEDSLLRTTTSEAEASEVRREALRALGYSGRNEVVPLIESAFASGNKEWIASALFAMGRSANEQWRPQVLSMLDNQLPLLRSEAARAAGELEISEAVPSLIELLDDPDESTRVASIWSLSQLGGEGVREALERIFEEAEEEEEIEYIESALDNLAFTEDMQLMPILSLPEDDEVELADDDLDLDFDEIDEGLDLLEDDEDTPD